jgi:hypothetical protein
MNMEGLGVGVNGDVMPLTRRMTRFDFFLKKANKQTFSVIIESASL